MLSVGREKVFESQEIFILVFFYSVINVSILKHFKQEFRPVNLELMTTTLSENTSMICQIKI